MKFPFLFRFPALIAALAWMIPTSTPAAPIGPQAGQTWTNTLGMVFKPVPGTDVLFNRYDTTVQDYRAFVQATGRKQPGGIYAIKVKDKAV